MIECLLKNNKKFLIFYFSTNTFKVKFFLEEDNEFLKIKNLGKVTIDIDFFSSLLSTFKNKDDLEIYKAEDNYLQLFSGKFKCNLSILKNLEIEEIKVEGQKISISCEILKNIYLKFKDFCKNPEINIEKNTILTNIHFKKDKNKNFLEVLSSDSYKTIYGKFNFLDKNEFEINVPPFILNLIINLFYDCDSKNVEIWLNKEEFICKKNEYLFKTKLDTGSYPDLIKWFDENGKFTFNLSKEELICALDRNLLFSEKNIKTAVYRLEEGKLFIEYRENEKGSCKEILNVDYSSSEKIEFSINSSFLKTLLKGITSEEVTFSISDSFKPVIIFDSKEKNNFKQFILPLRNA